MQISRKRFEIETWYQLTTNRKWPMADQMMTSSMTSRDPEMFKVMILISLRPVISYKIHLADICTLWAPSSWYCFPFLGSNLTKSPKGVTDIIMCIYLLATWNSIYHTSTELHSKKHAEFPKLRVLQRFKTAKVTFSLTQSLAIVSFNRP